MGNLWEEKQITEKHYGKSMEIPYFCICNENKGFSKLEIWFCLKKQCKINYFSLVIVSFINKSKGKASKSMIVHESSWKPATVFTFPQENNAKSKNPLWRHWVRLGGHGSKKALSLWKIYGKFMEIIYGKAWVAGWVWVVAMAGPVWKELDHWVKDLII